MVIVIFAMDLYRQMARLSFKRWLDGVLYRALRQAILFLDAFIMSYGDIHLHALDLLGHWIGLTSSVGSVTSCIEHSFWRFLFWAASVIASGCPRTRSFMVLGPDIDITSFGLNLAELLLGNLFNSDWVPFYLEELWIGCV